MYKAPLLPTLDVPELNTKRPLTPLKPAFAVRTVKPPLDVEVPSPVITLKTPPVNTVLTPDSNPNKRPLNTGGAGYEKADC